MFVHTAQSLDRNVPGAELTRGLPFIRLFKNPESAIVLDFLFENYNDRYTEKEIADINGISIDLVREITENLLEERIILKTREGSEDVFTGNFSYGRTGGLRLLSRHHRGPWRE